MEWWAKAINSTSRSINETGKLPVGWVVCSSALSYPPLVKPSSLWQALTPHPHHGCFPRASQRSLEVPKNMDKTPKRAGPCDLPARRSWSWQKKDNLNTAWGKQKSRSKDHTKWFLLCGCIEKCRSQCGHWLHTELSLDNAAFLAL